MRPRGFNKEVIRCVQEHPDWDIADIATNLGCSREYVSATLQRKGLKAAPSKYRQATRGWKPIKTVPLGIQVLFAHLLVEDEDEYTVDMGIMLKENRECCWNYSKEYIMYPDYWQHLPPAPKKDK